MTAPPRPQPRATADPTEDARWAAYIAEHVEWEARWPEPVFGKVDEEMVPIISWRDEEDER